MKKKTGCRFCDKKVAVRYMEGKPVHFFGIPDFKGRREDGVLMYAHKESDARPCTNPAYAEAPAAEGA